MDISLNLVSNPSVRMADLPANANRPTLATVREIDFITDAEVGPLHIGFSRTKNDVDVENYGHGAGLKRLLIDIHSGDFWETGEDSGSLKEPFDSTLSLNNKDLRYIIYVLSDKNWQFSRAGWPITVGQEGYEQAAYFDAFRVDKYGYKDKGDDRRLTRDGCRVAYFIANGDKALEKTDCYSHPINLNIDLVFLFEQDSRLVSRYMPIIIDPDIRHPGGSD